MAVEHVGFEVGQGWRVGAWAKVGPDDAAALVGSIGGCLYLLLEVGLGWFVGHVDARAVNSELPAVVHASEAGLFVATEEQRRSAMRAVVLDQSNLTVRGAKADQIFAEQAHPEWRPVRFGQFV